jgi:crossover junction endodeoxyribonuclease RusA
MEIPFPFEFVVRGVPLSLQASVHSRQRWSNFVRAAASTRLPTDHLAAEGDLSVTIIFFSLGPSMIDTDNMAKPILDALNRYIWIDDRQVLQLICRKSDLRLMPSFTNPTLELAAALDAGGAFVYVRVGNEIRHEELPP